MYFYKSYKLIDSTKHASLLDEESRKERKGGIERGQS